MDHAERRLEPDDPERRVVERGLLGVVGVGRVVGGDAVDHALLERLPQGGDVRRLAQRRVHLGVRVVGLAGVIGEREVVRRHLGGDADPLLFGAPDQLHRPARRHVAQVDVPAGELRQQDIALHHDFLGGRGDPLETEPRGHESLVHDATRGEGGLLTVVRDRDLEGPRVFERGAHEVARRDRPAVVRHGDRAGADHLAEFGETLPPLPDGDGANGIDAGEPGARRLAHDEPDRGLIVGDRIGVGHGADGAEASRGRGAGARGDRLDVLVAGLPQMDVQVHQPGSDHMAPHVAHLGAVRGAEPGLHRGDLAVLDEDVRRLVEAATRVDHPPAREQQRPHHSVPRLAASASSGRPPARR